jgi:hypothetical protein
MSLGTLMGMNLLKDGEVEALKMPEADRRGRESELVTELDC